MSSKEYINIFEKYMNDDQRDAMTDLYMKGINKDSHVWVTYSDVEDLIVTFFKKNRTYKGE
jgi:hypothetical protein